MESVGGYAYFVSEGTLSADPKYTFPKWVKIICVSPKYVLFIL